MVDKILVSQKEIFQEFQNMGKELQKFATEDRKYQKEFGKIAKDFLGMTKLLKESKENPKNYYKEINGIYKDILRFHKGQDKRSATENKIKYFYGISQDIDSISGRLEYIVAINKPDKKIKQRSAIDKNIRNNDSKTSRSKPRYSSLKPHSLEPKKNSTITKSDTENPKRTYSHKELEQQFTKLVKQNNDLQGMISEKEIGKIKKEINKFSENETNILYKEKDRFDINKRKDFYEIERTINSISEKLEFVDAVEKREIKSEQKRAEMQKRHEEFSNKRRERRENTKANTNHFDNKKTLPKEINTIDNSRKKPVITSKVMDTNSNDIKTIRKNGFVEYVDKNKNNKGGGGVGGRY